MPKVGGYGLEMMFRTCTVQVNFDFGSEADMVKKFRVGAGAAAGRDRAVRQFAVPRGQAERLPLLSQPDLDRCRQCARRHAALRLRRRLRLRALCRLRARCADVFRLSRRQVHRCRRQDRSAISWPARFPSSQEITPMMSDWADHLTTIFPEVRLKKLPRNARRRRRHVAAHLRPAGAVGRAVLRSDRARCRLGPGQGLDGGRTRSDARQRAHARLQDAVPRHERARAGAPDAGDLDGGLRGARARRSASRARRASSSRSRNWSTAARRGRRNCSRSIAANGRAISAACSTATIFSEGQRSV